MNQITILEKKVKYFLHENKNKSQHKIIQQKQK